MKQQPSALASWIGIGIWALGILPILWIASSGEFWRVAAGLVGLSYFLALPRCIELGRRITGG